MKLFAWISTLGFTVLTIYLLSIYTWWSLLPGLFMMFSPCCLSEEKSYSGNAFLFLVSSALWMAGCFWLLEADNWNGLTAFAFGAIQTIIILWYSDTEDSYGSVGVLMIGWLVYAIFFSESPWTYSLSSLLVEFAMMAVILIFSVLRAAERAIRWVLNKVLNLFTVKEEISRKVPNAFKAEILKKKRNAISVGIFTEVDNRYSQKIEISSNEGVSDELYEGLTFII